MRLAGQTAIITGASSGIGTAVARDLSSLGVRLVLTARRAERLEALCRELPEADFLAGDLTDPDLPQRLLERAEGRFGTCEIVVNNAGILETGDVGEIDLDRVQRMVRLNVEAAYRMALTALEHFKQVNAGHLVNVSSVLGTKTRPRAGAYSGTKYALEALSESLRMEFAGTPIKVSCLAPGLVRTELHDHYSQHPADALGMADPLQPEDVARCVRFILDQPPHVLIPRLMVLPKEGNI